MKKNNKTMIIIGATIFVPLFDVSLVFAQTSLENPIGIDDPRQIVGNVIKALLGIVGSLALAVFILGGFYWVTSAGSEEKIKKGKDMVMWATLGLAVIFASYALVTFVLTALGGPGSQGSTGTETPESEEYSD